MAPAGETVPQDTVRKESANGLNARRGPFRAVLAVAVAAYAVALLASSSSLVAAVGLLTHVLAAAPGVLIARRVAPGAGWLVPLTFGPILGHAFTSVALLGFWAAGGRGAWMLAAAPALTALLAVPAGRLRDRWRFAPPLASDAIWLLLVLLIVPLVVTLPFSRVGVELADGQAYRAYFTADYVWRRAVVLELVKGDFLPVNPFYYGDTLHYYWLPHLQSAVEYLMLAPLAAALDDVLLVRSVLTDAMFVALLYGVTRQFVRTPWAAAAAVTCCLLFTSFEGLYVVWDHWRQGVPLAFIRSFNIDAASRWLFGGMPVDGLHRLLWYQPHHALGYGAGLLGLLVITLRQRRLDPVAMGCGAALLGLSILVSSFAGLMFTAAAALHEGISIARWRDWPRAALHVLAAAVPLLVAVASVFILEYVDRGGQVLMLGLNRVATRHVVVTTILSVGPVLALAGAGAAVAWRARRVDVSPVAAVLVTCVIFYFYVDVRDHQNVYVGWRAGHLTFMVSGALIGLAFERLASAGRWRRLGWSGVLLIILASAPTFAIDLYNTQDVTNREMGPGFRWTLVLSRDELDAFAWMQRNTFPDDLFQVDPFARDANTWAYLPAFADRRMYSGLPISMVPLRKYEERSRRIAEIYDLDPVRAHHRASRAHVKYIVVGPPEREAHPGVEERFAADPSLLVPVYRNPTISIYAVASTGTGEP